MGRRPKGIKLYDKEQYDNNMLFGVYHGEYYGLNLNNKVCNRSANVLVIGGTGTGKTFKYIKPNILQENCSMIVTDPSGDIFRSFAPYLLQQGYNVYLFNASNFKLSNNYNPLLNVFDSEGEILETQVDILVDLYMKNAKQGKEQSGGDPFWDKSEKAFMTALIYYTLEEDKELLENGFFLDEKYFEGTSVNLDVNNPPQGVVVKKDAKGVERIFVQGMDGGQCFSTILKLVQEAKVSDDDSVASALTLRLTDFFGRTMTEEWANKHKGRKGNKTHLYYDTFLIAPQKTANTILITTAVDLQIFSTHDVDMITRLNTKNPEKNIDIDKIATQQSYLFLGIPQSHQAYNFLIAMLYSQLYGRFYELGERKLRGKYHIGYTVGTPVFALFDSEKEAIKFYTTLHDSKAAIERTDKSHPHEAYKKLKNKEQYYDKDNPESSSIAEQTFDGITYYKLTMDGKEYKTSVLRDPLEKYIRDIDKMYIWKAEDYCGGDPALPIHVNFLLDEFKNIGEIPNFLTILSTSRKYRIGSHVVIQDIGQIKTLYKENEHETLIANVDTIIFLGSSLKEDKEEIQKMLGKTTILQKSTSSSNSGPSTSWTPTETDLMSMDEIAEINQMGRDDEIVFIRDTKPMLCRKLSLLEHKRYPLVKKSFDYKINGEKFNAEQYYTQTQ